VLPGRGGAGGAPGHKKLKGPTVLVAPEIALDQDDDEMLAKLADSGGATRHVAGAAPAGAKQGCRD